MKESRDTHDRLVVWASKAVMTKSCMTFPQPESRERDNEWAWSGIGIYPCSSYYGHGSQSISISRPYARTLCSEIRIVPVLSLTYTAKGAIR